MCWDLPKPAARLLFLRSVWELHVAPELPRCEPTPRPGASRAPRDGSAAEQLWSGEWSIAIGDAASRVSGAAALEALADGVIDHRQWSSWWDEVTAQWMTFFQHSSRGATWRIERARRRAERRGLRRLLVLPLAGHYVERGRDGDLLVSMAVFTHERQFVDALDSYGD